MVGAKNHRTVSKRKNCQLTESRNAPCNSRGKMGAVRLGTRIFSVWSQFGALGCSHLTFLKNLWGNLPFFRQGCSWIYVQAISYSDLDLWASSLQLSEWPADHKPCRSLHHHYLLLFKYVPSTIQISRQTCTPTTALLSCVNYFYHTKNSSKCFTTSYC